MEKSFNKIKELVAKNFTDGFSNRMVGVGEYYVGNNNSDGFRYFVAKIRKFHHQTAI